MVPKGLGIADPIHPPLSPEGTGQKTPPNVCPTEYVGLSVHILNVSVAPDVKDGLTSRKIAITMNMKPLRKIFPSDNDNLDLIDIIVCRMY